MRIVLFLVSLIFCSHGWTLSESYLPSGKCPLQIEYSYYTICYEAKHRQALWTKHKLTLAMVNGKQKRTDDYRPDYDIEDPVSNYDYWKSGFDRGHLVPAGDMKQNYEMMSESFYMSNISPQVPSFNRGIWASIEDYIRDRVRAWGTAHVVTAPVLDDGLEKTKKGISIPQWYYKIAYFPKLQIFKAFLIKNKKHNTYDVRQFEVTVDEIEWFTGLDFFAELPDSLEASMEALIYSE